MNQSPKKITVAFCKNQWDKRVRHKDLEMPEFWRLFKDPPDVRRDKGGPGITAGRFDRDAWRAAPGKPIAKTKGGKGTGWLLTEYCLASYGYLGDLDNPDTGPEVETCADLLRRELPPEWTFEATCEVLDKLGIAYAAYTTHSHSHNWSKIRFVIPFAEPLKGTPEQIAAGYGAVHDYFNSLFNGQLDSRRSPAFMAYLPAVHPNRRDDYQSVVRRSRPLIDMSELIAEVRESDSETTVLDFPAERDLPAVALAEFKISEAILETILHGPQERGADRSAACASVYVALDHAGATPAAIASVCWDSDYGISERWHERGKGYHALCHDIARVLSKQP